MNKNKSAFLNSEKLLKVSNLWFTIFSFFELFLIILELGYQWHYPESAGWVFLTIKVLLLISYIFNIITFQMVRIERNKSGRTGTLDFIIILAILFFSINLNTMALIILLRQFVVSLRQFSQMPLVRNFLSWLITNPAQLTMFSFMGIILTGTILLTFPAATKDGNGASFLTALFTATSATCVTGLIVVDTGSYFSIFGQTVILGLIQIGALGIMTLSTSLALVFGRRFGLREQATLQDLFDIRDSVMLKHIIIYIVKMTFWVELTGAVLLYVRLAPNYDTFYRGIYSAIFHSISAFCNAGFSLYENSMVGYQNDLIINFTICTLIIIGGIGFTVVANIVDKKNYKKSIKLFINNLTIHTKIVLITTSLLISIGMILIFFFEFDNALLEMPFRRKILAAFFQSVTLRTAGFNTIELAHIKNITILIMIIWMFIGAAPGSTGGGIKVSTVGVLVLTIKTLMGGRREVEIFKRTIPQFVVYKSVAIFMVSITILGLMFGLLLINESHDFTTLLFEATSAFGTVGLSLGITASLSSMGRMIIIILMYIGRVGPLTLAYAISEKNTQANVHYPAGRLMVG